MAVLCEYAHAGSRRPRARGGRSADAGARVSARGRPRIQRTGPTRRRSGIRNCVVRRTRLDEQWCTPAAARLRGPPVWHSHADAAAAAGGTLAAGAAVCIGAATAARGPERIAVSLAPGSIGCAAPASARCREVCTLAAAVARAAPHARLGSCGAGEWRAAARGCRFCSRPRWTLPSAALCARATQSVGCLGALPRCARACACALPGLTQPAASKAVRVQSPVPPAAAAPTASVGWRALGGSVMALVRPAIASVRGACVRGGRPRPLAAPQAARHAERVPLLGRIARGWPPSDAAQGPARWL